MIPTVAILAATALAHFDLNAPKVRYANLDTVNDAPCGGSNTVGERQPFPIVGGRIAGQGYHKDSRTFYKLSLKAQPTTNEDFNIEIHPSTFAQRTGPFEVKDLDLSKIAGVRNGATGTIQVTTYDSHDYSYACSDVVFQGVDTVPAPAVTTKPGTPAQTNQASKPSSTIAPSSSPSQGTSITSGEITTTIGYVLGFALSLAL